MINPNQKIKNMFKDNPDLYPTPTSLISKMWRKVDSKLIAYALEPSAGSGAIADYLRNKNINVKCIEKDPDLRALLLGKGHNVIDIDFLTYGGTDAFDVVIMNPPFSSGEHHLLKAIQTIYNGQIVCLLNSETIRNPHTVYRQDLLRQLDELKANIEFVTDAFSGIDAERKTKVEVAIIYIDKRIDVNSILFDSISEVKEEIKVEIKDDALMSSNPIEAMVERYNHAVESGMTVLKKYFQEYRSISRYIKLSSNFESGKRHFNCSRNHLNQELNDRINDFVREIRKDYWNKALKLKEIRDRMTDKKRHEFYDIIEKQCVFDFTENNIRTFISNLIRDYESILSDAVEEIFDKLTHKHHWSGETGKNVHYFNGWKTNKAFKVNKKVILPLAYSGFVEFNRWNLDWKAKCQLDDIDIVMNYFDGKREYQSASSAVEAAFKNGENKNIESTYFNIVCYKKGTAHLTFKSEDIRRRFNICAGKRKNWLPSSYGQKRYSDMSLEEKQVVKEFEGKASYRKNLGQIGFKTGHGIKLLEYEKTS